MSVTAPDGTSTSVPVGVAPRGGQVTAFSGWPGGGPAWTAEELALLGTAADEVIAERIGRTVGAVMQKRQALRIKVRRDRRLMGNR